MISHIRGKVFSKGNGFCVFEVGGIGLKVWMPFGDIAKLPGIGEETQVFTFLNVREDALDLFGFCEERGLDAFNRLITISGVGPKAALSILGVLSPGELAVAVMSGDVKAITRAPGIGGKIAQRVILELKDKPLDVDIFPQTDAAGGGISADSAAVNALIALGSSPSAAQKAVMQAAGAGKTTEEVIKDALRLLKS